MFPMTRQQPSSVQSRVILKIQNRHYFFLYSVDKVLTEFQEFLLDF